MKFTILNATLFLIGSFFLSFIVFKVMGGTADSALTDGPTVGAMATVGTGVAVYVGAYIKNRLSKR